MVTCLDLTNGQNSTSVPYGTIAVTHPGIKDPTESDFEFRLNQYQAEVGYSCDSGTKLIGPENRTCTVEGRWTGNQPMCFGE